MNAMQMAMLGAGVVEDEDVQRVNRERAAKEAEEQAVLEAKRKRKEAEKLRAQKAREEKKKVRRQAEEVARQVTGDDIRRQNQALRSRSDLGYKGRDREATH